MSTYANYVAMTISNTPGTGTANLGSALSSPDQSFLAAFGAVSTTVDVEWYSDATTTTRLGCERNVVYNGGSPGTLTRGTPETPGSLVNLPAGASVRVVLPAAAINEFQAVAGVFGSDVVSITGGTTLTSSAFGKIHHCTGTSANYTVGLPAASGNAGKLIGFRMGSASALTKLVTLDGNASETIDGATTRIMWATETAVLLCDGSNWFKVAGRSVPMVCHLSRSTTFSVSTAVTAASTYPTFDWGTTLMHDTVNNRPSIVRPGRYNVSAFLYCTGTTLSVAYVGANVNSTSSFTPYNAYAVSGGVSNTAAAVWTHPYDMVVGDYVVGVIYALGSGMNVGAAPSLISVEEIPQW